MSHSQSADQQLSVDDLLVVMEELNNIRAKWYNIGLQLRMSVGTLDAIKEQYDDPSHCLRETLKTWLKTCPSPPTWNNIVDGLRSRIIDEVRLAADLEQKYCSAQDTNTSIAVTHHHAPPAPPSQACTQTTSPQQSQSQGHVPLSSLVSPSQAHTLTTTLVTQSTVSPTQQPMLTSSSYSVTPTSHPSPSSAPYCYSPRTGYPLSTLLQLTPPTSGVATASLDLSYSQVPQVVPTSSRSFLPSVPAQLTTPQFPTALPQYPSPPSFTAVPPGISPILPLPAVTTPPHLPLPVTTHTLGMKVLSHQYILGSSHFV